MWEYPNLHKMSSKCENTGLTPYLFTSIISHLDYCNALLAGLPACSIKTLQIVKSIVEQPKGDHVTLLVIHLYWLTVTTAIKQKSVTLACKVSLWSACITNSIIKA